MTYHIGQVVPFDYERKPIQAEYGPVAWFAFQTPPQKEPNAKAWLDHRGVEAWYPSETRWRRIPRGKRTKAPYEARLVPRYIFARFTGHPDWHQVRRCKWLSRVIGINDAPLAISDIIMAEMEMVPKTLEVIRQRERDKRTIKPGDKVRILDGTMADFIVDVSEVHAGIAKLVMPLLGGYEAQISVDRLRKIQPLA